MPVGPAPRSAVRLSPVELLSIYLPFRWRRLRARLHRLCVALGSRGVTALRRPPGLHHAATPGGVDQLGGGRARILLIDTAPPRPDRDSGSLRLYSLMRLLTSLGYAVTLYCEEQAPSAEDVERLRAIGVRVLPPAAGYPHWLRDSDIAYCATIVCRYHLAWHWLPLLRHALPGALHVLDTVDLHHLRERREADLRQSTLQRMIAARTRHHELRLIRRADATWVVSAAERDYLARLAPGAQIDVVPNLHDQVTIVAPFDSRNGMLFVGGGRHPPNVDAVSWLLGEIFPRIRARLPDARLHIVGDGIVDAAGIVRDAHPGVTFHDHVADLAPLLAACRVSIAPLRFGAGVKGKVTQALVHGLPVVTTANGAEGLYLEDRTHAMIDDTAPALAAAAVTAHEDPGLWQRLSENGRLIMRQRFSLEGVRDTLAARLPPVEKA